MRYIAFLSLLLLSACGYQEAQVINGTLITPELITREWADSALAKVKKGEVQYIVCYTRGGDAEGAIALAEELQALHKPIRVAVPYNNYCISAGAIIWSSSAYRTAAGNVTLHIVGNKDTGEPNVELNKRVIKILARSGFSQKLQNEIRDGAWDKEYPLTRPEVSENFRSPE